MVRVVLALEPGRGVGMIRFCLEGMTRGLACRWVANYYISIFFRGFSPVNLLTMVLSDNAGSVNGCSLLRGKYCDHVHVSMY